MRRIADVPIDTDLSRFSQWLYAQGVDHRIAEEHGVLVLYLENPMLAEDVLMALKRYLEDAGAQEKLDSWVASEAHRIQALRVPRYALYMRATPVQAPIIFLLIALSLLIAMISDFGHSSTFVRYLLILDPYAGFPELHNAYGRWSALLETMVRLEFWRLLTPDLIHFNVMHITFNLLMLWVLGGQLEIQKGSLSFLALVVFVSIVSNVAQLLETHFLFGGLSGVVYGLVGYCWVWKHFQPEIFFPDALLKFALVWLILGYTPLTEWVGLGRMANAAHLYGLLSGLIWGAVTLLVNEKILKKNPRQT